MSITTFSNYIATKKLTILAQNPIHLSHPTVLTPERLAGYYAEACGFKLLYGTEKVTEEVVKTLFELSNESLALEKMQRMQAGEIMNEIVGYPSERRAVLHTATRDFFDKPQSSQAAKEAAKLARHEVEKLHSFIAKLEVEKNFSEMIMIGIGGSDLGPQAHYYALRHLQKRDRKVFFISNVDPDNAAMVLKEANLKTCLVVVVSKSGNTLETSVNEEFVRQKFKAEGLEPNKHFIAVTIPGSLMDNTERYLDVFHLWDWIGGRYSTTSMVGGVMLSFMFGFDVYWEFLKGANAMDKVALESDPKRNLPLLSALLSIWNRNFLGYSTIALIPYSQPLFRYPAHIQQVSMESNGKRIDRHGHPVDFQTGPIIWGEAGTNAQHSFFQLLHQGTSVVPMLMIGFKESQCGEDIIVEGTTSQEKLLANMFAQALALAMGQNVDNPNQCFPGDRPTSILIGQKLTPFSVGALLAFFEHKVAFEGFIWDINSFDQEGVQLGKRLATQILQRFAAAKKGESGTTNPLADALLNHL